MRSDARLPGAIADAASDQRCRVSSARVALGVIENPGQQGGPVAVALSRDPAAKGLDRGEG